MREIPELITGIRLISLKANKEAKLARVVYS
jgi:hypothetical protein